MFWPSCQSERSNRVICLLPVSWGGESKPSSNEGGAGWATYIRLARLALSAPLPSFQTLSDSCHKSLQADSSSVKARPGGKPWSGSLFRVRVERSYSGRHCPRTAPVGGSLGSCAAPDRGGRVMRADTATTDQRLFHNLHCTPLLLLVFSSSF